MTLKELVDLVIQLEPSYDPIELISNIFVDALYDTEDTELIGMYNNVFRVNSTDSFSTVIAIWYCMNLSRTFSPNFTYPQLLIDYELKGEDIPQYLLTQFSLLTAGCRIKYREKWLNLYKALFQKYDIIRPYTITYEENESNNLDTTNTVDETATDSGHGTNKTTNDETTDSVYAFNSGSNGVPSDKSQHTEDSDYTDSNIRKRNNTITYDSDRTIHRTYTRKGNSGNITSQEQIRAEIELRRNQMTQIIFDDLNAYFTLGVY